MVLIAYTIILAIVVKGFVNRHKVCADCCPGYDKHTEKDRYAVRGGSCTSSFKMIYYYYFTSKSFNAFYLFFTLKWQNKVVVHFRNEFWTTLNRARRNRG